MSAQGPDAEPSAEHRAPLTERQRKVLAFVERSIRERGYPPTLREVCAELGVTSTNGASDHLRALERKGYLRRDPTRARAMVLVGAAALVPSPPTPPPTPPPNSSLAALVAETWRLRGALERIASGTDAAARLAQEALAATPRTERA